MAAGTAIARASPDRADLVTTTTRQQNGRVPPHDIDAERAALGAAMLSPDAARQLVGLVSPDDFYDPVHQHIAKALADVVAAGARPDPITVNIELGGLLDDRGGMQYLLEVQTPTPSVSNVGRYAERVVNTATARRVLALGADITELGYTTGAHDPSATLTRAGELLDRLAARTVTTADRRLFTDLSHVDEGDPESPKLLTRQDGALLLYVGRENALQGEPASGKTWVGLMAAAEVLAAGGLVILLDLEDTARTARARLRHLGVPAEQLEHVFHTDGRDLDTRRELTMPELAAALAQPAPHLVIVDSIAEAFTRWELDEDKAADANRFRDALVKPLTRAGTTVITLDHVTKSAEQRGRYARGTGAKLSGLDGAAYTVNSSGFNRTTGGRIFLKVAKDRPGGLPGIIGETIAQVWMPPTTEGHAIRYAIETPPPAPEKVDRTAARTAADHQLHDELRAAALDAIEAAPEALSRRRLLASIRARRRKDRLAGFTDAKLDPVLADLEAARAITRVIVKGHEAFAPPPTQQALPVAEEPTG